jgi:hypothetical protein
MSFFTNENIVENSEIPLFDSINSSILDNIAGPEIITSFPPKITPPTPISNICFIENTYITTDQGDVPIEKINTNIHTICNNKIVSITKTITLDKYLICFGKNSLGMNYPTKTTVMSKDHKIYYRGKMIEAYKFANCFENVYKVKYDGSVLYNVLMKKHTTINANNLKCETLHPNNIIAKLYTNGYSDEFRNKIIVLMNKSIVKNDVASYKSIVRNL